MLSNRGYVQSDGDLFNLNERKGFSQEVIADAIENPSVQRWVQTALGEKVPSNAFLFFVMSYPAGAADRVNQAFAISARVEAFFGKALAVTVRSFVS
jgi:hypothetical protein